MQRIVIFLLFILIMSISCSQDSSQYDIRKLNWGMSKSEVIKNEVGSIKQGSVDNYHGMFAMLKDNMDLERLYLINIPLGDYVVDFSNFYFYGDKLFEFEYLFFKSKAEERNENLKQIANYFNDLLIKKYGDNFEHTVTSENGKDYTNVWENERTMVQLVHQPDEGISIYYHDNIFRKQVLRTIDSIKQDLMKQLERLNESKANPLEEL